MRPDQRIRVIDKPQGAERGVRGRGRRPDTSFGSSPPTGGVEIDPITLKPIQPADLTPEVLRANYGMPLRNQRKIQEICDRMKVVITIRPTTPWASELLKKGLLPKPQHIKAKTITPADLYLGFFPEDLGKVGFKKPTKPVRPAGMPDQTWAEIQKRYFQREQEYNDIKKDMEDLMRDPANRKGGKGGDQVLKIDPRTGVITDAATGKAFTGDHDLFEIYDRNGQPVRGKQLDRIIKKLGPYGVEHNPHLEWEGKTKTPAEEEMFHKIVGSHAPGGEPLLQFGPRTPPVTTYYSPPSK